MDRFLEKLLEKWISIPRIWRMGTLTLIVFMLLLFFLGKGFSAVLSHFAGFSLSAIAGALLIVFLLLIILK